MDKQPEEAGQRLRMYQVIELGRVHLDEATQPRVAMDQETIQEYVGRMRVREEDGAVLDPEGVMFTPIVVFDDGKERWLADGFHRVAAAAQAGLTRFQTQLRRGTRRDAILYSFGANARHGKRRTNADKRQAVARALMDTDWNKLSDSQIAELCCVSQPFVSKQRRSLVDCGELEPQRVRKGVDGKSYRVENIGGSSSRKRDTSAPHAVEMSQTTILARPSCAQDRVAVLLVRTLSRKDWYDVAHEGVPLLRDDGVLIVPQTRDLSFAVSHLMRERISYQGATVLPGPRIFQIWSSCEALDVPHAAETIEELICALPCDLSGPMVEFCPAVA